MFVTEYLQANISSYVIKVNNLHFVTADKRSSAAVQVL